MDTNALVNVVLAIWFVGSVVCLAAIEAFTVYDHIPTISERVQRLGRQVPLVSFLAVVATVALLIHFFFGGL